MASQEPLSHASSASTDATVASPTTENEPKPNKPNNMSGDVISQHALNVDERGQHPDSAVGAETHTANNIAPAAEAVGPAGGAPKGPGGPGGPGGKPKLNKFAYGFWSPEMKMFRGITFKILGSTLVITTIVMWLTLPLYWGSLWKSNKYTDKLTVRVIDRDGGEIGQQVSQYLLAQKNLRYFTTSPSEFPDEKSLENNLVNEGAWAAIVITAGATQALATARSVGNASYNGSQAIHAYYVQARQENAVGNYLLPYMQAALGQISTRVSTQSAAQYLQANANNATAINALASAPSTIGSSISYTLVNLRPYNQPVANAITLVGLIYMLIFAFIITMTNNAVREIIAPFLTTRSYIMYRLISPIALYLPISFFFSMVNLPFKIHFGAKYTYGGGFFLWAFTTFLGMTSLGLATEFAITILGPKFMAFFLVPWIIVNVSVVVMPHELQPWIYRYGPAMPFYNISRVVRTIIFDTKNEIGQNLGILLAWIVLSLITITVATWLFRRGSVNAHNKAVGENEFDDKETARAQSSNDSV